MAEATLSLEQFSDVLRNINPGLGPAASQLWQDGVNTENLLRMLTKEDMQQAGINLGNRVLIYNHYHPIDADSGQTLALTEQVQRLQMKQDHIEARYQRERAKLQRSITSANEVGKRVKSSPDWTDGNNSIKLYALLDAKESTVVTMCKALTRSIPHSWEECMQLEVKARAQAEADKSKKQKLDPTLQSAQCSASTNQPASAILKEREVQLAWAYVLRQLKKVGGEHAQWHLIDTSQSGLTGHSGKVDFCFSAVHQKAWPQVVAMAELKKALQLESQHTECIGQLAARSVNIFAYQEKRNHVFMIAGGLDALEILAFFSDGAIQRSGIQPWSFDDQSPSLRWLCKLLLSTLPAMGFQPELPPLLDTTPQGMPIQNIVFLRAGAPTTSGSHHACKVFQAQYGVHQELVALKVGVAAEPEADMLARLKDDAGVIKLVERGTLSNDVPYLITRPFGNLLAIDDSADLILKVIGRAALIIERLAKRKPPVLHRDISVGNLVYCGEDQETFLIDFGAARDADVAQSLQSITGTSTFIARSVLEGEGYSLSSELESLMYVLVFLAVNGVAHWANQRVRPAALLSTKVASFAENESFNRYVVKRCRSDLVGVVERLQKLFWQPSYQRNISPEQFHEALILKSA